MESNNGEAASGRQLLVRVTSSTHHLSQIALRELMRRIRRELPELPPESVQVELGPYGAFDVRAGGVVLCETSKSVLYPAVADIVTQLRAVLTAAPAAIDHSDAGSLDSHNQRLLLMQEEETTWETWTPEKPSSRTSSSSVASLDFAHRPSGVPSVPSPDGVVVGVDPNDADSDTADEGGGGSGGGGSRSGGGR